MKCRERKLSDEIKLNNMPENDSLEIEQRWKREQRRLDIYANKGRLKEVLSNELNT